MQTQFSKDFSILLTKVTTANSKKDIAIVSGLNKTVQQIEQSCKVNPGELMSDPYFGANYYQYKFEGFSNKSSIERSIRSSIQYGNPSLLNVFVELADASETSITFNIKFNQNDLVNFKQNQQCTIEVPI